MEFRHEYKFMISVSQSLILKERILGLMKRDVHGGEKGSYEIRSIYFDDRNNSCLRQNEAGTDPRAKYRIRSYHVSDENIVLEKKIKQNGMTKKLQQQLTKEQYEILKRCDDKGILRRPSDKELFFCDQPPLIRELLSLKQMRQMQPKVIVAYERTPFVEAAGNVRVTFDDNIASSTEFDAFFSPKLQKRPIMPAGQTLMEVKFDEFLPKYIKEALEIGKLSQTAFSKYYLCRRYSL